MAESRGRKTATLPRRKPPPVPPSARCRSEGVSHSVAFGRTTATDKNLPPATDSQTGELGGQPSVSNGARTSHSNRDLQATPRTPLSSGTAHGTTLKWPYRTVVNRPPVPAPRPKASKAISFSKAANRLSRQGNFSDGLREPLLLSREGRGTSRGSRRVPPVPPRDGQVSRERSTLPAGVSPTDLPLTPASNHTPRQESASNRVASPGYSVMRTVSGLGDFGTTASESVSFSDSALSEENYEEPRLGDESQTESESQPLERRNGTPLAAQDISNSSCTKDDRHRLGCCSGLAAGIYLLLVMACTAGVVLCCLLPYSCWFKIDAGIHTCRGMQNTTRLYPYRSEITLSSMGCWLLLQAISVAILLGRKSWFSRSMKTKLILKKLLRAHHFWFLIALSTLTAVYDLMESFLMDYGRQTPLPKPVGYVVSALWITEMTLSLTLVSLLNFTGQVCAKRSLILRVFYRFTILFFALFNVICFLSNTLYVTLKVMPDNRKVPTEKVDEDDGAMRLVAYLLLVVNCVLRYHLSDFYTAKLFEANSNVLHSVHKEVLRYRSTAWYLSTSHPSDEPSLDPYSTSSVQDAGYSPVYYECRAITPAILQQLTQ